MAFDPDLREAQIARFLEQSGWGEAELIPLGQDASTRRYLRLRGPLGPAMLMDAPGTGLDANPACAPEWTDEQRLAQGWNAQSRLAASRVDAYAALATHLNAMGYSAPKILAMDAPAGLAITEDLGDDLYAHIIPDRADEIDLYQAAGALLADLHEKPAPKSVASQAGVWPLLEFDALALRVNAMLFPEWMPRFEPEMRRDDAVLSRTEAAIEDLIDQVLATPKTLVLRDYHAENLLWLPERHGHARVGLLDFQDAVIGPRIWDWSMLLHDARRDVSPQAAEAAARTYLDMTGVSQDTFDQELALAGALNTLRILGLFARLVSRDKRDKYNAFVPREWRHLKSILAHPALADMSACVDALLPDWRMRAA